MSSPSPPKPWEQGRAATTGSAIPTAAPSAGATSLDRPASAPALPERPSSLTTAVNRNAAAMSYGANRYGASPYGSPYGGAYSSPYSRMGYGGYGAGMGGGMYGGYGSMYGGYGGMYGNYGGMPQDPNDPNSLTQSFNQSTQATFQLIEGIVGAFGGFAQMLESTYMATHSSFFAMVAVAEQFGNLRNTLGSVLGIFTIMRCIRTLIAKITGRPPPADATSLTPSAFARFEGRKPDSSPRPSRKPLLVFVIAAFGLPYLMGKLIRTLAQAQDEAPRLADGLSAAVDPNKLDFCRVLYDFTPETGSSLDLEVKKGDLVAVLSKSDPLGNASEWWRCRARDGRMGYLPGVYLEPARRQVTEKAPVVEGKAGDLSVESFQKSQFFS